MGVKMKNINSNSNEENKIIFWQYFNMEIIAIIVTDS